MKYKIGTYKIWFAFMQLIPVSLLADTIYIDNINIHATREQFYHQHTNNTYAVDSFSKSVYGNLQLQDLLQYTTNIYINNYGLGATATISMRGTADDQTTVFWNGVNIRSTTLGTTDISLLPFSANSKINIVTNSASSVYGSGAFGGSILLSNEANWKNKISSNTQYILGSFQQHAVAQNVSIGNTKVQFQTQNFFQKAESNFFFKDVYLIAKPIRQMEHNAMQNWATQNYIFLKLKNQQQINIGSWVQQKQKEIPANMGGNLKSNAWQNDFSVKNYILYKKVLKKGSLYNRFSTVYDFQNYTNPDILVDAKYKLYNVTNSINYRHYFKRNVKLDIGLDYFFDKVNTTEYNNKIKEHRASFFVGAKHDIKQFSFNASARQEMYNQKYIRPMFAFQMNYVSKSNLLTLNLNYADKFRLPDFNDKYWIVGGNPDLLPEKGYSTELNVNVNIPFKTTQYNLALLNSIYFTRIKDNIVWSPLFGSFWQPQNIKNTQHYGFETSVKQIWNIIPQFRIICNTQYALNKSTIIKDIVPYSIGKFLRYKPLHKLRANIILDEQYFFVALNYNYNSIRFTDDENSRAFMLPAYHLLDFIIGYKLNLKNVRTQFIFQVNNITNTSYEVIRSYAQLLRNYRLTFQINYSQ